MSLFTRREDEGKLERFYTCLRTPITPGEPETRPFTLPPGVEPAPRLALVDHPDWEIPRPTLVGVAGFLGGWIAVAVLIAAFYWILGSV